MADDEPLYTYTSANDIASSGRPFYVGYEDELGTGMVLARRYLGASRSASILLFGLPGNGKSNYPRVLAYDMQNAGTPCAILWVQCGKIAARLQPDVARDRLEELRRNYILAADEPLMIVLDEMDAIATDRADYSSGATVCHWTFDTIRWSNRQPGKRLILGISNNPNSIEKALLTDLRYLYFNQLSQLQAVEILRHHGVPDAEDVMSRYAGLCSQNGALYSGRSLVRALECVQLLYADEWDGFSSQEMARAMFGQGGLIPSTAQDEYESGNEWVINSAAALVDSLRSQFAAAADPLQSKGTTDRKG